LKSFSHAFLIFSFANLPVSSSSECRSSYDEVEIIKFLKSTTAVGLLPPPHSILVRRLSTSPSIITWFTSFLWGYIFLNIGPNSPWRGADVKLFRIKNVSANEAAGVAGTSSNGNSAHSSRRTSVVPQESALLTAAANESLKGIATLAVPVRGRSGSTASVDLSGLPGRGQAGSTASADPGRLPGRGRLGSIASVSSDAGGNGPSSPKDTTSSSIPKDAASDAPVASAAAGVSVAVAAAASEVSGK
jgi:hypothetical protein